jgi:micrococcal nuclease
MSERVRFVGVDTPETVKLNTSVQCYGPEASSYTKKMLTGREVWLTYKPDERLDKYGRTLAYIWLNADENGTFELFDLMLIEQGYGRAYTVFPFDPRLEREFVAAESRAKEAKRGLWGACAT